MHLLTDDCCSDISPGMASCAARTTLTMGFLVQLADSESFMLEILSALVVRAFFGVHSMSSTSSTVFAVSGLLPGKQRCGSLSVYTVTVLLVMCVADVFACVDARTMVLVLIGSFLESWETDVLGNLPFVAELALTFLALQTSVILTLLLSHRLWRHIQCLFLRQTGRFAGPRFVCLDLLGGALWSATFSFGHSLYKNKQVSALTELCANGIFSE